MRKLLLCAFGLLIFAISPAPAPPPPATKPAPGELASPVPAKAAVVVTMNGWGKARGRLETMLKNALPDMAKKLGEDFDKLIKTELLEGRELKGIDPDRRVYFVVEQLNTDLDVPPFTLIVPTTDATAFFDGFFTEAERKTVVKKANGVQQVTVDDESYYAVTKDGFTFLSNNVDRIASYLGAYETLGVKQTGPDVAATMATADLSIYVNMEIINEFFGEQIKQFRGLIEVLGKGGLGGGGFGPGMDKDQMEAGLAFLKGIFQFVEDSRAFALCFEFKPQGLGIRLESRFEKDSTFGKVLATEKPSPLKDLAKLPPGYSIFTGQAVGPRTGAGLRTMVKEFSAGEENEDAKKAITAYQEMLNRDETLTIVSASTFPDKSITVTYAKDANTYVDTYTKMVQALPDGAKSSNVIIKGKPIVTLKAQTAEGFTFHKIVTTLDFEATVKDQPAGQKETTIATMKKMAKEKTTTWLGTNGKVVVSIAEDDWANAEKSLKSYLTSTKTEMDLAIRKELPEAVSYLTILDSVYAINYLSEAITELGNAIPNIPVQVQKMEKLKSEPVFMGLAVTLKPEHGKFDLFVPVKAVGFFHKAFSTLFSAQ